MHAVIGYHVAYQAIAGMENYRLIHDVACGAVQAFHVANNAFAASHTSTQPILPHLEVATFHADVLAALIVVVNLDCDAVVGNTHSRNLVGLQHVSVA